MAAAKRAMEHFPVPPGSTRIDAAPTHAPHLKRLHVFDLPVDQSLTQTRWWLVPFSYRQLVSWYVAHTEANRDTASYHAGGRLATDATLDWQTHIRSNAFSPPSEVVGYARLGPRLTGIRTDVTLAARFDRTRNTLVPPTVTSLEITRRAIDGTNTTPTAISITEPTHIFPVINAFNHVAGAYHSTESFGCGSPVGLVYRYAVTFHWPGHTLAADYGEPLCGVGRGLTLDGAKLRPTLTDSNRLTRALKAAYDGS